jgi:hypothetical protein
VRNRSFPIVSDGDWIWSSHPPRPPLATESRGASNAKAKRELGWTLLHPSWRQGLVDAYT